MKWIIFYLEEKIILRVYIKLSIFLTTIVFLIKGININKFTSLGCPLIDIHPDGVFKFNNNLTMINTARYATLGRNNRCKFVIQANANLIIGNNVAMSNATIVATEQILIGDNVMIGGGVIIVDSDFHSQDPSDWYTKFDIVNMKRSPVIIKDNVFVGMNSIILKGVTLGYNSVIAAGSVVVKNVPDHQVWGGNPAQFIKLTNNIL